MYIVSSGIQNMQSVSLPDGTEVQLGPGSKLTYPSEFSSGKREVSLDGQAFFDVYKNPHKPFVVHTADMDIEALGTAFEVFSYGIENKSEAILLNGKIRVNCNGSLNNKNGGYLLSPDEKIVFDKRDNSASVQDVDADKYTAWRKQRILSFENEKLSMIIPRLEQWYGRKIMCQQDLADKYRFTFKIRDESLERILFMMGASSPLKYKETSNGNYQLILK
ncbi:FecR domain-containing protein [Parabacteroides faecis]|nr:FecR domain-containing protein [Parabacteroides faecis]MCS2892645.1 FecR domain-containing protein [Parabacteroides faecis]UVQ48731.1 FecR domain-containing protein [Parabacteroides faecis]